MSDSIIWQSVRNIVDSVNSLEALSDVIARSILKEFQNFHVVDEGWEGSDEDGWIEPMFVRQFTLRRNRRANARIVGWISVGFQLTSDAAELEWDHGPRAKLLIGSSRDGGFYFGTDFPNVGGEAEDIRDDESAEKYYSDGFRWNGEHSEDWFFAVPLDTLEDEADVQRLILTPLAMMIGGTASAEALEPIMDNLCLPPDHQLPGLNT